MADWPCIGTECRTLLGSISLIASGRGMHAKSLGVRSCKWDSRRHAVKAISGPKHIMAMTQAKDAYEVYDLGRWGLKKTKERA